MLLLCWESYRWAQSLWVLIIYLFFLPVMLPSVLPRLATDWAVRVLVFGNFSLFKTPFLGQSSIFTSFVSFFVFYIFSYLLLKTMGCFSGCLMSSASIQKLFCGVCLALKCSFDEFVREKVVSPSYSSAIFLNFHCCSVAQWCPTLCDLMDCSLPGFSVLLHLPEFSQTQVH